MSAKKQRSRKSNRRAQVSPRRQGWCILFIFWAFIALLSLYSFDPAEVAANQSPPEPSGNYCGAIGVWLAFRMLMIFGIGAFVIAGVVMALSVFTIGSTPPHLAAMDRRHRPCRLLHLPSPCSPGSSTRCSKSSTCKGSARAVSSHASPSKSFLIPPWEPSDRSLFCCCCSPAPAHPGPDLARTGRAVASDHLLLPDRATRTLPAIPCPRTRPGRTIRRDPSLQSDGQPFPALEGKHLLRTFPMVTAMPPRPEAEGSAIVRFHATTVSPGNPAAATPTQTRPATDRPIQRKRVQPGRPSPAQRAAAGHTRSPHPWPASRPTAPTPISP